MAPGSMSDHCSITLLSKRGPTKHVEVEKPSLPAVCEDIIEPHVVSRKAGVGKESNSDGILPGTVYLRLSTDACMR